MKMKVKRNIKKGFIRVLVCLVFLSALIPTMNLHHEVNAAAPKVEYMGSAYYGVYQVPKLKVNGEFAFCIQHHKNAPPTGTSYTDGGFYNNAKVRAILYYGYGGPGNIVGSGDTAIVATTIALDSVVNGTHASGRNSIPGYQELMAHAAAEDAPDDNISFSKTSLSTSISGDVQKSESVVFRADSKNSITLRVPSGVNLHLGSNKYTNQNVTIKGGQSFYFTAGMGYGETVRFSNVKPSLGTYQPILFLPSNTDYQRISQGLLTDPSPVADLRVNFEVRQKKITVQHLDEYDNRLLQSESYTRNIGSNYSFSPESSITNGGNKYLPVTTKAQSGTVGNSDIVLKFYYNLERTITVNHIDARDNRVIATKSEKALRGDTYSYSPRTDLKKGSYTYRPLSTAKKSGTVGAKNIVIDFYYDVPVIKTGLEKIQVYTAPAAEGLPVKVTLSKENIYPETIEDMGDITLNVALYKGSTKIDSNTYSAKALPKNIDFHVPSGRVAVNEKSPYTVKLEGFSKNDIDVIADASEVTTDGYTSSEKKINIDMSTTNQSELEYTGVVMTEREVGKNMNVFYEQFSLPLEKLERMRTGYGFHMPLDVTYMNEIGTGSTDFSFNMKVPEDIVDTTYITYQTSDKTATVPLEQTKDNTATAGGKKTSVQKFELQHVNVEKQTGALFTDSQVQAKDSRIKHDLVDGERKFYLPMWSRVGDYSLSVESVKEIGVNEISFKVNHDLNVFAHVYAHMDSETIEDDAILFVPVDTENPFPEGLPEGWTEEDLEWLKNN